MFSLKQKVNQILSATIEKINFCFFKKTVSCASDYKLHLKKQSCVQVGKELQMGKGKRKAIHTD